MENEASAARESLNWRPILAAMAVGNVGLGAWALIAAGVPPWRFWIAWGVVQAGVLLWTAGYLLVTSRARPGWPFSASGAARVLLFEVVAAAASALAGSVGRDRESPPAPLAPLPHYGWVADFAFADQTGTTRTRAELDGSVWIADFIFTRCQGPCPLMTARMAGLARDLPPTVKFVSFSVDPEFDTPDVLRAYAETYGADPARWYFLTGDRGAIFRLARDTFRVTVGERQEAPETGIVIPHSTLFLLVDRQGRYRGFYGSQEPDGLERLTADARALATAP